MQTKRKPLKNHIFTNQWSPDVGEQVFVPSFNVHGEVVAICPRLVPHQLLAESIWYLVQFKGSDTASLFLREELISDKWVNQRSRSDD